MSPSALRRQIGQLLIAGFNGHQIPPELRSLAKEFSLGGVILFARNVADPEQVAELAFEASRLVPELPLWVSVDQEGGRVARLKSPFTEWPPMATLGRSGDEKLAERFARALAFELKAVGITLDYAPVLDVHTNPRNTVIGDRALAENADDVARLGATIIRTLQAEGIAACGKHFPGHGDTSADSHHELPLVEHSPERLREVLRSDAVHQVGVAPEDALELLVRVGLGEVSIRLDVALRPRYRGFDSLYEPGSASDCGAEGCCKSSCQVCPQVVYSGGHARPTDTACVREFRE